MIISLIMFIRFIHDYLVCKVTCPEKSRPKYFWKFLGKIYDKVKELVDKFSISAQLENSVTEKQTSL